jgi:hypothetical protein
MLEGSIFAFLANARAVGVAAITPGAGVHFGFDGAADFLAGAAPPPLAAFWISAAVIPN